MLNRFRVWLEGMMSHESHESHDEREFHHKLIHVLEEIASALRKLVRHSPTGGIITQISGGTTMDHRLRAGAGSNSVQAGGSVAVFQVTPTPAGTSVPAADTITFAADDPNVVISAGPIGPSGVADPTTCSVMVPASDTAASFNLNAQFSGPDFPTPVVCTPLNVAIVPAGGPPPTNLPTGGTIAQLS